MSKYTLYILIFTIVFYSCQSKPVASIVETGLLEGFEKELLYSDSSPVTFEPSAVIYCNGSLIGVNDKEIPGSKSVFEIPFNGQTFTKGLQVSWMPEEEGVQEGRKLEAMTYLPEHKLAVATTAFDRILPTNRWDTYNVVVCWKMDGSGKRQVVESVTNGGIESSSNMRLYWQQVLVSDKFKLGTPYFKIEGLTQLPGDRLLFGFRAIGLRYDEYDLTCSLVSVGYYFRNDSMFLFNDYTLEYDASLFSDKRITQSIGLSSIEYDSYNDRLIIATSFENELDTVMPIGAYLWVVSMDDFASKKRPALVETQDERPLVLINKAEGITILNEKTIFVVYDNDRFLDNDSQLIRQYNQAPYSIITIE